MCMLNSLVSRAAVGYTISKSFFFFINLGVNLRHFKMYFIVSYELLLLCGNLLSFFCLAIVYLFLSSSLSGVVDVL